MNKITKEMCIVFIKDYYKYKVVVFALLSIFLTIGLWFFTGKLLVVGLAVTLILVLMINFVLVVKRKIENINLLDFYVVEDIVLDFKKRLRLGKSRGTDYDYIYTFKKYGKHVISKSSYPTIEIPLHKEKNISHLNVDRLSTHSCNIGDMFYLLIYEYSGQKKIIKCFCKYHFDILKEDFDYADGKYYCKNDIE